MKQKIALILNNHFDLMWRRCFDRKFESEGLTYVSYADIEEYYLLDHIELALKCKEYCFEVESISVLCKFLERHPKLLGTLQELCNQGRFYVTGTGNNIIDTNMVLGESIVRNYLYGQNEIKRLFCYAPTVANRMDAFGNSAQLPQILNGFGMYYLDAVTYTDCDAPIWKGLDGSSVKQLSVPSVGSGGHYSKYPPCPVCKGGKKLNGVECNACKGRGINRLADNHWKRIEVDKSKLSVYNVGKVMAGNEELLPNQDTINFFNSAKGKYDVAFCTRESLKSDTDKILEIMKSAGEKVVGDMVELNPNNSGCWVTRIKTKQTCRRQEHSLLAAESIGVMSWLKTGKYDLSEIEQLWNKLLFTMFHDAITGTHIDAAYEELKDIWTEIDQRTRRLTQSVSESLYDEKQNCFSIINPTGVFINKLETVLLPCSFEEVALFNESGNEVDCHAQADETGKLQVSFMAKISPYSSAIYYWKQGVIKKPTKVDDKVIENERYCIFADDNGIISIYDKMLERKINSDRYRPFEMVLEHDEGSPWATLSSDRSERRLNPYTKLISCEKSCISELFKFEVSNVDSYGLSAVSAKVTIALQKGSEQVYVNVSVNWDDYNHRLKLVLPLALSQGRHLYEIPYGVIERKEYKPEYGWSAANGDWPAVHWAGVWGLEFCGILYNHGTPCYTIKKMSEEETVMAVTLLRSPTVPTFLHEPDSYTMRDWEGMRDCGEHNFEFQLECVGSEYSPAKAVKTGLGLNAKLIQMNGKSDLPEMPVICEGEAIISSMKLSEDGKQVILRICNYLDKEIQTIISIPQWAKSIGLASMDEQILSKLEVSFEHRQSLTLSPHMIMTCYLEK